MDYNTIKTLLSKYLEGNTTLTEENILKDFFNGNNNIPDDILYAKYLFEEFKTDKSIVFDKQIVIPKNSKKMYVYISGIAASFLIAFFLIFSDVDNSDETIYAYYNGKAITDKALAEKYTKEALMQISQNLNNGTKNLNKLSHFNKSQSKIKSNEK